jgi:hypothetical protein
MKKEMNSLPKSIVLGAKVQLRDGVLGDVKIRQWEFSGEEKMKISLYRREGFILEVGTEDIDWGTSSTEGERKRKHIIEE